MLLSFAACSWHSPGAGAAAVAVGRTLPQKEQKYLECWLTSIFLICLRRLAP